MYRYLAQGSLPVLSTPTRGSWFFFVENVTLINSCVLCVCHPWVLFLCFNIRKCIFHGLVLVPLLICFCPWRWARVTVVEDAEDWACSQEGQDSLPCSHWLCNLEYITSGRFSKVPRFRSWFPCLLWNFGQVLQTLGLKFFSYKTGAVIILVSYGCFKT